MAQNKPVIGKDKQDFFNGRLAIICNTPSTNIIYVELDNIFNSNITKYLKSSGVNLATKTSTILKNSFAPTGNPKFSKNEVNQLISNQNSIINTGKDLWTTVAGSYEIAKLSQNNFVSVCLYGETGKYKDGDENKFSSSIISSGNLVSNPTASSYQIVASLINKINSGRFSIILLYINNINNILNFTKVVTPTDISSTFMILLSNNSKNFKDGSSTDGDIYNTIDADAGAVLARIIFIYSLLGSSTRVSDNTNSTADIQDSATIYNGEFSKTFSETIDKFVTDSSDSVTENQRKSGKFAKPLPDTTALQTRLNVDQNPPIILPEINPSGITLNTFVQPPFNQPLSILDIIRNERQESFDEDANSIVVNVTQEQNSLTAIYNTGSEAQNENKAIAALKPEEKQALSKSLNDRLVKNEKQLEILKSQKSKIEKSPQYTLGKILSGQASTASGSMPTQSDSLVKSSTI